MGTPRNTEQERLVYKNEMDLRRVINAVTPQQNQWAIACNDHCLMLFATWWRMVPPSAPRGMHLTSPKDMMVMMMKGDTGHVAMDDCHSWNCGCAGTGPFYHAGMIAQYCSQKIYNACPTCFKSSEDHFDQYLRLPKDPSKYPGDEAKLEPYDPHENVVEQVNFQKATTPPPTLAPPVAMLQMSESSSALQSAGGDVCVALNILALVQ